MGHLFRYAVHRRKPKDRKKEVPIMRGYFTPNGYRGLIGGRYVLFASETDYYEAMDGFEEENG